MARPTPLLVLILAGVGCAADKPGDDSATSSTTTTTTTTTVPTTSVTTNTTPTTPPDPFSKLRIVHIAADLGSMDMFMDEAATPVLNALVHQDGTDYTDRPVGLTHFDYSLTGNDASNSLVEFDQQLFDQQWHSHAIVGEPGAYEVWQFDDNNRNVGVGIIRIRWVHAAVGLGPVDLSEAYRDLQFATGLTYGDSVIVGPSAGAMSVGVDYDSDGVVDWTFEDFDLGQDILVNIYITDDGLPLVGGNTPFLIAHKNPGLTPRRDVL